MARLISKIVALVAAVFKAFFGIREEDNISSGSKKVAVTTARRILYVVVDYWATFACAALVGLLNYWEWTFMWIVIATWVFDFTVATIFMVVSEKSGQDITLGESFRRAADVIHSAHKIAGYLTFAYLNVKATIWDGPEQVVIFFKKEIGSMARMTWCLVGLTLVQGLFWAWVYSLGYESVSEVVKHFLGR